MTKLPASQVRKDFAETLKQVAYQHDRIGAPPEGQRRGRPRAHRGSGAA